MSDEVNDELVEMLKYDNMDSDLYKQLHSLKEKFIPCSDIIDAHMGEAMKEAIGSGIPRQMFSSILFRYSIEASFYSLSEKTEPERLKKLLMSSFNRNIDQLLSSRKRKLAVDIED